MWKWIVTRKNSAELLLLLWLLRDMDRRKPLSTRDVYNELIYQRIAQGFQIVLHDKPIHLLSEATAAVSPSPFQGQ